VGLRPVLRGQGRDRQGLHREGREEREDASFFAPLANFAVTLPFYSVPGPRGRVREMRRDPLFVLRSEL
jgi:hypothetical protein